MLTVVCQRQNRGDGVGASRGKGGGDLLFSFVGSAQSDSKDKIEVILWWEQRMYLCQTGCKCNLSHH